MKRIIVVLIILGLAAVVHAESNFIQLTPEQSMVMQIQRTDDVAGVDKQLNALSGDSKEIVAEKQRLKDIKMVYYIIEEYSRHFHGVLVLENKDPDVQGMLKELKLLKGKAKKIIEEQEKAQ